MEAEDGYIKRLPNFTIPLGFSGLNYYVLYSAPAQADLTMSLRPFPHGVSEVWKQPSMSHLKLPALWSHSTPCLNLRLKSHRAAILPRALWRVSCQRCPSRCPVAPS